MLGRLHSLDHAYLHHLRYLSKKHQPFRLRVVPSEDQIPLAAIGCDENEWNRISNRITHHSYIEDFEGLRFDSPKQTVKENGM